MNKVAANTMEATEARRQYVYKQKVRASLVRTTGPIRRKETREYTVVPQKTTTDKILVSFSGEYRDGKQMVPYTQPSAKDKGDQRGSTTDSGAGRGFGQRQELAGRDSSRIVSSGQ
jgi:hypothetical protein